MADNNTPLTIYLSLTSSPSSPRTSLTLDTTNNNGTITASELRLKASKATLVPLTSLKLIFRGRVIGDKSEGDVVKEFKLEDGCVVHVMGKPVASSNAATASASATTSTTSSASASAAAGASVTVAAAAPTSSTSSPLLAALLKLRTSNEVGVYRTALTTADKLLGNIVSQPMEEKYRTIKKSNPAFTKRLGGLPGGQDLMTAAGFVVENREGVEYYVLTPSADAWPRLVAAREEVQKVVSLADNNSRSTLPPPVGTAAAGAGAGAAGSTTLPGGMPNLFSGGMPGAGGMGAGGGGMPDMSMMQSMMSDPNMLQNVMGMMNNPTVQNMMRNDPRFANNPMLQQSLQALQSNPEMMNQMASMMGDPNVRDRMANMMQQQQQQSGTGGAGADPFAGGPEAMRRQMEQFQQMAAQHGGTSGGINAGGGGNSGTSAAGASGGNANNGSGGGNDSDMTEEEMIAEAIARSLRES